LEEGWEVFWPASGASRADFLIRKEGTTLAVQVKKAAWATTNDTEYLGINLIPRHYGKNTYTSKDFDLLVAVDWPRYWIIPISEVEGRTSIKLDVKNRKQARRTEYNPDEWLWHAPPADSE
jgi:hypothetical protein